MDNAPENLIKNFLQDPAAMEQLTAVLGALGGGGEKKEAETPPSMPLGLDNPEMLVKIGQLWSSVSAEDDPRLNLLSAIKPYLSEKRTKSVDRAMQILKLSKLSPLFQELHIL